LGLESIRASGECIWIMCMRQRRGFGRSVRQKSTGPLKRRSEKLPWRIIRYFLYKNSENLFLGAKFRSRRDSCKPRLLLFKVIYLPTTPVFLLYYLIAQWKFLLTQDLYNKSSN